MQRKSFENRIYVSLHGIDVICLCPCSIKTADNADASFGRAARRCFAFGKTCFAAALELSMFKRFCMANSSKQRQSVCEADRDQRERRVAQPKAASALSAFFTKYIRS